MLRRRRYEKLTVRKKLILEAAAKLAKKTGYMGLTREEVAKAAKVSPALINTYFPKISVLKKEVLKFAIENGVLEIIAQGLAVQDPLTKKVSKELIQQVSDFFNSANG